MNFLIAYLLVIITALKPNQTTRTTLQASSCECCHHKTPMWKVCLDYGTFFAALIAALATCAYAVYTQMTYKEISGQTQLLRKQLVGSQAAKIEFPNPEVQQNSSNLRFLFSNATGQVMGVVKDFRATIHREDPETHKSLGDPITYTIKDIRVGPRKTELDDEHLPWILPIQVSADKFPGKEVTIINVQYSYDDGFGDSIPYQGCFFYLPPTTIPFGAGWSYGSLQGGPHPCDVDGHIREFHERMKEPH